ncbi:hypothetical protein DE146DRAFT_656464 [Phaeosphaeria sp. MPI-PUGE-AT-0046c]|nr:hypothetical protein DE146DRAFT_656464 [Phaeosphaeria sp. MPI-PUGE-AT-0046c]
MQLLAITSTVASVALLSLPVQVHAQNSNGLNPNLTLRFFTSSQDDSCDFGATGQAITFTTESIPVLPYCFDLADLFDGNATSGFVNQTGNRPNVLGEHGIHWSLSNTEAYDASANYSSVLYRQHISSPNTDDQKPGHRAERRATIYPGKGCTQKDPNDDKGLLPWFGLSCLSEDKGRCGTTPYSIQSFYIQAGDSEKQGTCWDFAKNGQSAAAHLSMSVAAVLVATGVTVWLAL